MRNGNKLSEYIQTYTQGQTNPLRAAELIQYSHVIHTISQQFVWDNVSAYDRDFRLHMGSHPLRNWSMKLQQAWSLHLREYIRPYTSMGNFANRERQRGRSDANEICRRFNRGKCNYGLRCKFEKYRMIRMGTTITQVTIMDQTMYVEITEIKTETMAMATMEQQRLWLNNEISKFYF